MKKSGKRVAASGASQVPPPAAGGDSSTPRIVRSTTLDALVDALVEGIRTARVERGPLSPVEVVVPHRAMGDWLLGELSARLGAVAHVRTLSPARLLIDAGVSSEAMRAAILEGLTAACAPDAPADLAPTFAAVRAYVDRDGPELVRRELRLAVLSEHVTRTFAAYTAHWPEADVALPSCGDAGAWQAQLFAQTAKARAFGPPPSDNTARHPPLFVFDVPVMGHDAIRAALWRGCPVTVLCRVADAAGAAHGWHRHGALRSSTDARWQAHGGVVVATLSSTQSATATPKPRVVSRLNAPSMRRACESIAAQLWQWVRDETVTPPLRFHECAVVVPASMREAALPTLREVFDEAHGLSRVVWRQPLGGHNTVAALVQQLLELPSTRMRRSDVLSILSHPMVARAWADELPEAWSSWLDAVGIFHGLDARSHAGTYLENDVVADWDQGLVRLALGAFSGGERSGEVQPIKGERGDLWPEEIAQSSVAALGTLVQLVRSLLSDADFIRQARLPVSEWAELLKTFVATYVRPTGAPDLRVRAALLRAFDDVATCGLVGVIGWDTVRREALAALEGVHAHQGAHLFQGVVVGTPQDLRGLPFRRVLVLGLQQGGFPSAARQDELDLRPNDEEHRPDDPRRRDSFALYDLIESVREEVCLVPIARDPLTGDKRELSLIGTDLETHAAACGHPPVVVDVPLHRRERSADRAFAWAFPESVAEQQVASLGEALQKDNHALPPVHALPPAWREALGVSVLPALAPRREAVIDVPFSRVARFLEYPTRGYAEQRLGYRSDNEDRQAEDDEPFENNALVASSLMQSTLYTLLSDPQQFQLADEAARRIHVAKVYTRAAQAMVADGRLPAGFFREVQRTLDVEALEGVLSRISGGRLGTPHLRLKWGNAAVFGAERVLELDPVEVRVVLEEQERVVRLSGLSQLVTEDRQQLFRWRGRVKAVQGWTTGLMRKESLSAWLEHLLLCCAGDRQQRTSVACGYKTAYTAVFPALSPAEAHRELAVILTGLLEERTGYCCPPLALLNDWAAYDDAVAWSAREEKLKDDIGEIYKPRGVDPEDHSPLRAVQALRLPTADEMACVRRRYSVFVACTAGEAPIGGSDAANDDTEGASGADAGEET